jgi:hypothetical protein
MPRTDTVIIGAGHAGPAMSRCLVAGELGRTIAEFAGNVAASVGVGGSRRAPVLGDIDHGAGTVPGGALGPPDHMHRLAVGR